MTEEVIMILIFLGLVFSAISHTVIIIVLVASDCDIFYTPKTIYENSNMNWLGTICVYILIFLFSFILAIGGFLRWLFTVGRKD